MTSPRRRAMLPALVLTLVLVAGVTPSVGAVEEPVASLRMVVAGSKATIKHRGPRVPLDLGAYVEAVNADFEIHIKKDDYADPFTVHQVDPATGTPVRAIPEDLQQGLSGLKNMIRVTFVDSDGKVAATKRLGFCPSGWERQRLRDTGAAVPRYPATGCMSDFPFVKGMVWGLDQHWATGATFGNEYDYNAAVRVPDGLYTVTIAFTDAAAQLFEIAPEHRSASLQVTTKTIKRRRRRHNPHSAGAGDHRPAEPLSGVPDVADPDPATLPDLVALPAWNVHLGRRKSRELLSFATTPWNAGPAPLWVEGFRRPGEDLMDAYQYFTDQSGNVVGRAPAGELEYHDTKGHNHWHFLQFAEFSLINATTMEEVRSGKQAFCITQTHAVDLTLPGAVWNPYGSERGSSCGSRNSLWVREVLEAGWGDTYYQSVAGQAFDITGMPNGKYLIRVEVDPGKNLKQVTTDNDVELRSIAIRGKEGRRRVVVAPWNGIEI